MSRPPADRTGHLGRIDVGEVAGDALDDVGERDEALETAVFVDDEGGMDGRVAGSASSSFNTGALSGTTSGCFRWAIGSSGRPSTTSRSRSFL